MSMGFPFQADVLIIDNSLEQDRPRDDKAESVDAREATPSGFCSVTKLERGETLLVESENELSAPGREYVHRRPPKWRRKRKKPWLDDTCGSQGLLCHSTGLTGV